MALDRLYETYRLDRASIYVAPGSEGAMLPLVYGGFDETGYLQTVEIDRERFIYMVANHAIDGVTNVYIDGKEVTNGYTVETAGAYQAGKIISFVAFGAEPEGDVYVRARGAKIGGTYSDDYVTVLEAILLDVFGLTEDDLDAASWAVSKRVSVTQAYQAAVRIDAERTPQEWLALWLRPINGSAWIEDGRLHLRVDDATSALGEKFALEAGDYVDATIEVSRQNQWSRILVQFGWDPQTGAFVGTGEWYFASGFPHPQLVQAGIAEDDDAIRWYGAREKTIECLEVMNATHATTLAGVLLALYKEPPAILRVTDLSRKTIRARIWDAIQIPLTWHYDASISTRNWRIIGRTIDAGVGAVKLVCIDTGTHG